MTILKVMFIIALGTYAGYEFAIRRRQGNSSGSNTGKLNSASGNMPANL